MNFCTKCGNPLKPTARFCGKCGETVIQVIKPEQPEPVATPVCSSCGSVLIPGVKFCTNCGSPVAGSTSVPPVSVPPPFVKPGKPPKPIKQGKKPPKKRIMILLKIAASIVIIGGLTVAGIYFFGTYDPGKKGSLAALYEVDKYDPVKIDSAATVVESVFAASDTSGLAKILSPSSLKQKRLYFAVLLPHMPAFARDFKTRKLRYATARFAVYEFSSNRGKFTAEFCLGDHGQWMLMRF
ncbi:MAG: zinc-ribbon domain-containing protein [Bacteroidetes bacterium]|nr:zinc-ribbon domain-containing protein [Bacteroidota bacterium]